MRVLELFSGTCSVGKVCTELGYETVSVDIEMPATHKVDIMEFDYKQYPKDYFDIVWASPPCQSYSSLQRSFYGRIRKNELFSKEKHMALQDAADKLVLKALEIIKYFNPKYWFLENPATGNLKNRDIMTNINYYDYDYCKYSDWGYKKRTRFWTNRTDLEPKLCKNDCENMFNSSQFNSSQKIHKKRIGVSKTVVDNGKVIFCCSKAKREKYKDYENIQKKGNDISTTLHERYRIPRKIIIDLFKS